MGSARGSDARRHGWPNRADLLGALLPERQLDGTPYRAMWRDREARLILLGSRVGQVTAVFGWILHYFLVDVPLHKEPVIRWVLFRFGGAAFFAATLLLTFLPVFQRLPWVRLPLLALTVVISALEARAVVWLPTVPYLYAFVLAVAGVILLRQPILGALASLAGCVAVQWAVAWQFEPVTPAKLMSATVLGAILILLARWRMAADVRAFLTERRELDAQKSLIETQIELDRVKTNFFTNVSHELRTPLTLIIAPLEATLHGTEPLTPVLREDLELALRNALRLLGEINTLLDLARLDARRERLRLQPLDVVQVVGELVESGRRLAERKFIDLEFAPACPSLVVPLDRVKVEKVVFNLLSNAIRFTDGQSGRRGRVVVRCGERGGRLWLAVEDTGIGIPAEHLGRIFDRFHQVDENERIRRGGTGIGLSLVKELVELHMGSVSAWSRPGEGSTFTVELPLDAAAYPPERLGFDADEREPRSLAPEVATPRVGRAPEEVDDAAGPPRPLVLVVDDNEELLDYLGRNLAEEFRSRTASSVDAALEAVDEELPDLVVSDLMMPERPGTELLQALRARPAARHVPFVLLTAKADPASRVGGIDGGADDYLAKPFSPMELRARVRSLLSRGRKERELVDRNSYLSRVNLDLALSKRKVLIETMEAFALAVEAKDPYTHGHSRRVSILAEKVCRELGLGSAACETVRIAGILHDIGKIGMPEVVLKKPGRLSGAEVEVFKRHSQLGSRIVSAVTELEEVGRAILHHHERFDGQGYPDGLAGEQIPILSRILTVCDSYDAMTSDRPYRDSVSHPTAIEEITRGAGAQFDRRVAAAFLALYGQSGPEYPELTSGLEAREMVESIRRAGG
jgi:putative nucleotidyltransferase with HDIG domain